MPVDLSKVSRGNTAGRHGAKAPRSKFIWINAQIIAQAESGCGLEALLCTTATHMPHMNLVNLTTAAHRLAKMVAHDAQAQTCLVHHPVFLELLDRVIKQLAVATLGSVQPQSLSNFIWALATARYVSAPVVTLIIELVLPILPKFKPFELSTTLWAIAKLRSVSSDEFISVPLHSLFDAAAQHIIECKTSFSFRVLSMLAWAFATVGHHNLNLLAVVAARMLNQMHEAGCQEMSNATWAYGTLGLLHAELFEAVVQQALPQLHRFKPQELSNMLWGFAATSFFHEQFFLQAANTAVGHGMEPQHLANILWAFARVRPNHAVTRNVVMCFLPSCVMNLAALKTQELSSIALSIAKAFGSSNVSHDAPPGEVLDFFSRSIEVIPARMNAFGTQSLLNMLSAFAQISVDLTERLLAKIRQEVLRRMTDMLSIELIRALEVFLQMTTDESSVTVVAIAGCLACEIEGRILGLPKQDIRCLSRICVRFFGLKDTPVLTRRQLQWCCHNIAVISSNGTLSSNGENDSKDSFAISDTARCDTLHGGNNGVDVDDALTESTQDLETISSGDSGSEMEFDALSFGSHAFSLVDSVMIRKAVKNTFLHFGGKCSSVRSRSAPPAMKA
jgi:hypothetical protein